MTPQQTVQSLPTPFILHQLQQNPQRLKEFLLQVPINDMKAAIKGKQLLEDLRFQSSRNHQAFKKNVLDLTLGDVIHACFHEGIIGYSQKKQSLDQARISNHPEYGNRLVAKYPHKYYVGQRSGHYNQASKIEEAYGIMRPKQKEKASRMESDEQRMEGEEEDNSRLNRSRNEHKRETHRQKQNDQQQVRMVHQQQGNRQIYEDEDEYDKQNDSFIDDQFQEQDEYDRYEEELSSYEEVVFLDSNNQVDSQEHEMNEKEEEDDQERKISQRAPSRRRLKKQVSEDDEQQIDVDQYILRPSVWGTKQEQKSRKKQKKVPQSQNQMLCGEEQELLENQQHEENEFRQSLKKTKK